MLEDASLKIDAELSDMLGKGGPAILDALAAGEADPVRLAALAHRYVKPRKPSWLTRREGARRLIIGPCCDSRQQAQVSCKLALRNQGPRRTLQLAPHARAPAASY